MALTIENELKTHKIVLYIKINRVKIKAKDRIMESIRTY